MTPKNPHIGSDFDDFLAEEGILPEVEIAAAKRVLAFQLLQAMEQDHLSKSALAEKMHTSRRRSKGSAPDTGQIDTSTKFITG